MAEVVSRFCDKPVTRGRTTKPCGKPVTSGPTLLSINGASYRLDLCDDDKQALEEYLQPYLSLGAPVMTSKVIKRAIFVGPNGKSYTSQDVREWYAAQGKPLTPLGRISNHLLEEYEKRALANH